jgi:hypothetical protein
VVEQLRKQLAERLGREERAAKALRELVQEKEEEYDWAVRIDGEEEDGDEGDGDRAAAAAAVGGLANEDDDDLFGDDEDVKIIEAPGPASASAVQGGQKSSAGAATTTESMARNPREGWSVADYVRYMDTGKAPTAKVAAA